MDLRLVDKGNRTMKIVGKQSVVAAYLPNDESQAICFCTSATKHSAIFVAAAPPFAGTLDLRISR
jgi:hypothetical protein